MLPIVPNLNRTTTVLPYVSANIVPVVAIVSLSATGELATVLFSWRNASNVHASASERLETLMDASATILAVIEGEEDLSTGDTSLTTDY